MIRKRFSTLAATVNDSVVLSESLMLEDLEDLENLEDTTVEDYKKLNEKCDKVISKIKIRKEQKTT
jgi:hypothetical protein